MANIVEKIPDLCNCIAGCMDLLQVGAKYSTLRSQEQLLNCRVQDMARQLEEEEAKDLCKKPKQSVKYFFARVASFKARVIQVQERFLQLHKWKRILMALQLHNQVKVGQRLLDRADQLQKDSLVRYEVFTRGLRLPVHMLTGDTANGLRQEAIKFIRLRCSIIGIHGSIGACKSTLMKFLYNDVYDDTKHFQAVFWAGAPKERHDAKNIQDCLADAMNFKFNDENVVRRGGVLEKRLKAMAPGHIVIFLDGLKESFLPDEVGIPIGVDAAGNFCCTLVFTARSEDVCDRMRATKFQMDLIPEDEARELFMREAGQSYGTSVLEEVVGNVVKQCARMPLVITTIARSMSQKEDTREWNNRLDEMMGIVENMNDEEAMILEQLKFGFNCLKDSTIQNCFLASSKVLHEKIPCPREMLIQHWIWEGLIGKKSCRGLENHGSATSDQGHTMINKLQRAYLLEIVTHSGREFVTMNPWIRKMAENICQSRDKNVGESMKPGCRGRKRIL